MDSVSAESYAAPSRIPVTPAAGRAIEHLNANHADAHLATAQALTGR